MTEEGTEEGTNQMAGISMLKFLLADFMPLLTPLLDQSRQATTILQYFIV